MTIEGEISAAIFRYTDASVISNISAIASVALDSADVVLSQIRDACNPHIEWDRDGLRKTILEILDGES